MDIDNRGEFTSLEDAQNLMLSEWKSHNPDTEEGDYIAKYNAMIGGDNVYLWRIIRVSFD